MKSIKQQILHQLLEQVEQKIAAAKEEIESARMAQQNETKSSAGDKYETSREMMTQEIEKQSRFLADAQQQRQALLQINPDTATETVEFGSLVFTGHGNYLLGASLGSVEADGVSVQTMSTTSPLGQQLIGKRVGDSFVFRERKMVVERVL